MELGSEYTLAVSGDKRDQKVISTRQYFEEIKRARIAVSPFGWGEVTYRDYEAIAYGCLLVKPNIDHVATNPAVFVPGESYVSVAWDYSDVVEKCRYYLEHWDEAEKIIAEARRLYLDFFEKDQFLEILGQVLE
jgi:spore maturation protein CgeB